MTLYEINDRMKRLLDAGDGMAVDAETGEVFDEAAIEALDMARHDKIDNIIRFWKNIGAEADALEAEAKKLSARAKALRNKEDWLEGYLTRHMAPGEKFDSTAGAVRWRKSQAVSIDVPLEQLPQEYIKVSFAPKTADIRKELTAGRDVPGAHLETRMNIQIK